MLHRRHPLTSMVIECCNMIRRVRMEMCRAKKKKKTRSISWTAGAASVSGILGTQRDQFIRSNRPTRQFLLYFTLYIRYYIGCILYIWFPPFQ
jgi:hypothetical protein